MEKFRRIKFRAGIALIALSLSAAALLSAAFMIETHMRGLAVSFLEEKLGCRFNYDSFVFRIYPVPCMEIHNLNTPGCGRICLSAERIDAFLSLQDLFLGRIRVDRMHMLSPDLRIKLKKGGKFSGPLRIPDILAENGRCALVSASGEAVFAGDFAFSLDLDSKGLPAGGRISCNDVDVKFGGAHFKITASATASGGRVLIDRMIVRKDGLAAAFTGTAEIGNQPVFAGNLALKGLRLDTAGGGPGFGVLKKFNADLNVVCEDATVIGVPFKKGSARISISSGALSVREMELSGTHGFIRGSVSRERDGRWFYDSVFSVSGIESGRITFLKDAETEHFDGIISADGRISNPRGTPEGGIDFLIKNGRYYGVDTVAKVFALLDLYKIMGSKKSDFIEKGVPFDTVSGSVKIAGGLFDFKDFSLEGNILRVIGTGRYDNKRDYLDAVIGIKTFDGVEKIIKMISVINWIMVGNDQKFIVINLRLFGKPGNLMVAPLPLSTVSGPLKRMINRIVGLPLKIIEKPAELRVNE
ncbi:MAG: AsmA-like C-terminal domain-containing protein [Spirochaetes bacterium]|jgi:hypothetical protein|nr:AsmA-like C-terminal domain-containing protein [Spirochaetota bacterium]